MEQENFDSPTTTLDHPDDGNFIRLLQTPNSSIPSQKSLGDGAYETIALTKGHGLETILTAFATPNDEGAMVGTCPNCRGFFRSGLTDFTAVDVDFTQGNGIKPVHVIYQSAGHEYNPLNCMQSGIVMIRAGGNEMGTTKVDGGTTFGYPSNFTLFDDGLGNGNTGENVYKDPNYPNDPTKDVKMICIGPVMDGRRVEADCDPFVTSPSTWQGDEEIVPGFRMASGLDKWPDATVISNDERIRMKDSAWIDLVAPAMNFLDAILSAVPFKRKGIMA